MTHPGQADGLETEISMGVARQGFSAILEARTGFGQANVFQSAGHQIIYNGSAPYRLAPYPLHPPALPPAEARQHPSLMLRPNFEVVPFSHRVVELQLLKKWREDASAKIAVMLLTGPGGQGKTRFAARVARDWAHDGWLTLRAFGRDDFSAPEKVEIPWADARKGVLFVADYAERWAATDLLTMLRDGGCPVGVPTRILLLARSSGYWWSALASRLQRELIAADSLSLSALGEHPEDRLDLFTLAYNGYLRKLEVSQDVPISAPSVLEADRSYNSVLTIHMAALAAVLAYMQPEIPAPRDPAELSAFLIHRERESWHLLYEGRRVSAHPALMSQAVYTATLAGPLPYADGLAVMRCAEVEHTGEHGQLIRDHALCYPPEKTETVLEPLYPDRLGEDFIALTLPGHDNPGYPPDPWATDALARLLSNTSGRTGMAPWTQPTKALIVEVAQRWPHVATLLGTDKIGVGRHRSGNDVAKNKSGTRTVRVAAREHGLGKTPDVREVDERANGDAPGQQMLDFNAFGNAQPVAGRKMVELGRHSLTARNGHSVSHTHKGPNGATQVLSDDDGQLGFSPR